MSRYFAALLIAGCAFAQRTSEFWPGTSYDPAVPTHEKVLGYQPGERITPPEGILRYIEALVAAAPRRSKLWDYGKTWEGRRLIYTAIGSESNIARLDEIKAAMQRLADPRRTNETEARKLFESLPAVIWLGYGVHGNEISSPDAALFTAYHLLAARKDPVVEAILKDVVVLIDPLQNPDGRDRFVRHFQQSEGIEPDANSVALEHTEPWPGGRTNHYHFDMNRDWFALTQPETRGRIRTLIEWLPLVFVDLHEMGSDSTYYFAPEAIPYNPHLTPDQKSSLVWFGKNNAKWFDQYGFSYFTREVYDAFYPGYGASWPSYYGSIAMTYEQASARGLLMRRSDDTEFTFRDTVRQHFVASISTCETSARQRKQLLENFYNYRRTAIEEGSKEPVREFILPYRGDKGSVDRLALLLADQAIEVRRASATFRNAGKEYPAGSYSIPLAQPAKRLIRTLLDTNVPMEEEFLKEQERRRKKKLPDEIYDVTAWSLPLLHNVECVSSGEPSQGAFEPVKAGSTTPGKLEGSQAKVAYLVPWGSSAGRFLTAALRQGLRVWSSDKGFRQNNRDYPRGTLILKVADNPQTLHGNVQKLAAESGATVYATDTGWVDGGVDFGSRYVVPVRRPTVAMAWDTPVTSGSAGHARFVLERQFGHPVTPVRTQILGGADLSRFHVIVLPSGSASGYNTTLGANGLRRLKDWISAGGTLIGLGGAVSWMADPKVALLDIRQEDLPRATEPPKKSPDEPARVPGKQLTSDADYEKAIQPDSEQPDVVAGVLVKARLDVDHWITAGAGETVYALVDGRTVFTPIKLDKGINAAVFFGPDALLASGYLWEENRKLLAHKPLVVVAREGRGSVIGFTSDPNYRAYLNGMNLLFVNAVFSGPAHAGRGTGPGEE
jgi:hypothetical protein